MLPAAEAAGEEADAEASAGESHAPHVPAAREGSTGAEAPVRAEPAEVPAPEEEDAGWRLCADAESAQRPTPYSFALPRLAPALALLPSQRQVASLSPGTVR